MWIRTRTRTSPSDPDQEGPSYWPLGSGAALRVLTSCVCFLACVLTGVCVCGAGGSSCPLTPEQEVVTLVDVRGHDPAVGPAVFPGGRLGGAGSYGL